MENALCGFYRNVFLIFILKQTHEVTSKDDPLGTVKKSSRELEYGTQSDSRWWFSELRLNSTRSSTEIDILNYFMLIMLWQ